MSLSWPGKVCLHMPSRMSHNWKLNKNLNPKSHSMKNIRVNFSLVTSKLWVETFGHKSSRGNATIARHNFISLRFRFFLVFTYLVGGCSSSEVWKLKVYWSDNIPCLHPILFYLGWRVAGSWHKCPHVWRERQRHHVPGVASVGRCLLTGLDIPQSTEGKKTGFNSGKTLSFQTLCLTL